MISTTSTIQTHQQLDTASRITTDKVHKDNMDNIKAWKAKDSDDDKTASFLQVSPMSCSRALADTCGKGFGKYVS